MTNTNDQYSEGYLLHHNHQNQQQQQQQLHHHDELVFGGREPRTSSGSITPTLSRTKVLKSLALLEAQAAVKFDGEGRIEEALEAYGRAVELLDKVMKNAGSSEEYERIQVIHDSYKYRILLLNTDEVVEEDAFPPPPGLPILISAPISTPTITTASTTAQATTTTTTTTTTVCGPHDGPPLSPLSPLSPQGVYYQGQQQYQPSNINMHSMHGRSAGHALTPHATAAASIIATSTAPRAHATTDTISNNTSNTPIATAMKIATTATTSSIVAAAEAMAATAALNKTITTTIAPATTGSVDESLKHIQKQPPAPAPVPIHSQPSASTSPFVTSTPVVSTTPASTHPIQQTSSSSINLTSSPIPVPLSQEPRPRRTRAGSFSATNLSRSTTATTTATTSTATTASTASSGAMSGHSPLRQQQQQQQQQGRLHAKAAAGGPSNSTTNHRITGDLVSAAGQLQLLAQQRLNKKKSLPQLILHRTSPSANSTAAATPTVASDPLSPATPVPPLPSGLVSSAFRTTTATSIEGGAGGAPSTTPTPISSLLTPNRSNPPTPDLVSNRVFLSSLPNSVLNSNNNNASPPALKSPTSPTTPSPLSISSFSPPIPAPTIPLPPLSSPVHRTFQDARRHQQPQQQQKTKPQRPPPPPPLHYPQRKQSIPKGLALLSPESSPRGSPKTEYATLMTMHSPTSPHSMDRNEIDEWLPKFLTKGFDMSESWLGVHDPSNLKAGGRGDLVPTREGVAAKGPLPLPHFLLDDGSQNPDSSIAHVGSIQPSRIAKTTSTTLDSEHKKDTDSNRAPAANTNVDTTTPVIKELKLSTLRRSAKIARQKHRRSLSQSSIPHQLLKHQQPDHQSQQQQQRQQQQLLSPPPLVQSNRNGQGRPSGQSSSSSRLSLYSQPSGSLSMNSLPKFNTEPISIGSSSLSSSFSSSNLNRAQSIDKKQDQEKTSVQSQLQQMAKIHQQQHQRKQSQGQHQPWVLVPRPQAMLRSQSSFSQLSTTTSTAPVLAALHSPTIISNTFASGISSGGGVNILDFTSDDPLGGLSIAPNFSQPPPPQPTDPFLRCFWLIHQLQQTMTTGGFFTRKLHIPRQVWYQRTNGATSMVRLPAADAKINACHTIAIMLEHMVGVLIKHGILEPIMTSSPEARESGLRDSGEGSSGGEGEGEGEVLESSPYSSSSNSSSSSFASPYSPFTPSLASFLTSSTTSNTSASSAITTSQPSTPATPTQSLFTNLAGFTSIAAAAATNKSKSNRNSANESEQAAAPPPTHSAIITFNTEDPSRATTTTALLIKELEALESATLQIWAKLSKKLSFVHRPGKYFGANSGHDLSGGAGNGNGGGPKFRDHDYHDDSHNYHHHGHHQHGYGASTTSATTVGTDLKSQWKMFSKSVQKSMANDKVEDTAPYTDSVLRLFQSANILEQLFHHYSTLSATASTTTPAATPTVATFSAATSTSLPQTHYTQIITCLRRIGDFLNLVICAFVVRDLGTFLAKYNKRVGSWIVE